MKPPKNYPLPWKHSKRMPVYAANGMPTHPVAWTAQEEKLAQFIVTAANSHAALLAEVERLRAAVRAAIGCIACASQDSELNAAVEKLEEALAAKEGAL